VRYSSLSISYSVAVSLFGGTTPLVFTVLLERTGSNISPAYYVAAAAAISFVAALLVRETAGQPLRDECPLPESPRQARRRRLCRERGAT
jgi:MFS transporter, MHS family, proline/betaine transporter